MSNRQKTKSSFWTIWYESNSFGNFPLPDSISLIITPLVVKDNNVYWFALFPTVSPDRDKKDSDVLSRFSEADKDRLKTELLEEIEAQKPKMYVTTILTYAANLIIQILAVKYAVYDLEKRAIVEEV